ncbi:MAG: oligosaccharide flippase family protein [Planctomycetota bacterium]|nr:oligosaccharide flippase family protein [Planctomycetota bacterium]
MAVQQGSLLRSTLANWMGLATGLAVTMILAPVTLKYLGTERFGVYGIVRQAIGILMILDLGILGAVNRLMTRYVVVGDQSGVNRVASVSFFLYGAISLVAMIVSLLGAFFGPAYFHVSSAYRTDAGYLFFLLGLNFVISLMSFPWTGLVYSYNRFDLYNVGTSGSRLMSLLLVVLAFQCGLVNLAVVGLAMTVPVALQFFYIRFVARRLNPGLRISPGYATRAGVREVVGFSLWNLLYNAGFTVIWSSDNILIGRLLGSDQVPYYYLPFQLIIVGQTLVAGMSGALTPIAAGVAAASSAKDLRSTLVRATRIAILIALCANGIMVVMVRSFLPLWIRQPGFEGSWVIYAVLMGGFWALFAALPAYNMLLGAGDIRGPAIGMIACGVVIVTSKIVLATWFGLGLVAIAWGTTVPLLVFAGIYMPWAATRMVGMPLWRLYFQAYLGPLVCLVPVLAAGVALVHFFPPANLFIWMLWFAILALIYVSLSWHILDEADRARILGLIKRVRPGVSPLDDEMPPPT